MSSSRRKKNLGLALWTWWILWSNLGLSDASSIEKDWESLDVRKNMTVPALDVPWAQITPSLAHPKLCANDPGTECQAMVESMRQQLKQTRKNIQRNLQTINHNPNQGDYKPLVLLVQFSDHGGRNLIPKSTIEELWNGEIKRWFQVNSQGVYTVDPVVMDWQMTDNTESFYANGKSGFEAALQKAMWPILDRLDNQPGWDWSQFDVDQDGRLDSVVMLHSGISAVLGGADCFEKDYLDRIWPHAFSNSVAPNRWESKDGSIRMAGYTVNSVYDDVCDDKAMTAGLTCHEYMHTFDLVDLYDYDLFIAKGVGFWDIMGHPYGADHKGMPGLLSTWSKMAAEWMTPTLITADGDYTLKPAHDNLAAYRIDITPEFSPRSEYFLIENRQPIGFETPLPGGGLLIMHIDDAADGMKNRGFKGQDGWPQNGNHYQVAVVPKDGNYDLEQNVNYGDETDLFVVGDKLGPGRQPNGEVVYPNTDSYQMGDIQETGIAIEVLSQAGQDIVFRVSGLSSSAASPQDTQPETSSPTAAPTATPTTLSPTAQPTKQPTTPGPTPQENIFTPVEPSPPPVTAPPTARPTVAATAAVPTPPPTDPPRWVLTRPPYITRAPFVFPEFPLQEPQVLDKPEESSAFRAPGSSWGWLVAVPSLVLGVLVLNV